MKKVLLVTSLFTIMFTFGQSNNQSESGVSPTISPTSSSIINNEIFRFKAGAVTGLESATIPSNPFDFDIDDRWFTLGQVEVNQTFAPGAPDFYGSRFQVNERALVHGYAIDNNVVSAPRIQWIHNGSSTADFLEFRVGNGFGGSSGPGLNTLVASMSPLAGNTYFGSDIDVSNPFGDNNSDSPKVGIDVQDQLGLSIINISGNPGIGQSNYGALVKVAHSSTDGRGVFSSCNGGDISTGIFGKASALEFAYGVRGEAAVNGNFSAGVYGFAGAPGSNNFAGFFDGDLVYTGALNPSDRKLKKNITNEENILERISLLRPVT